MKKIILLVLVSSLGLLSTQLFAQTKTLLDQKNLFKNVGFMISPNYGLSAMDGGSTSLFSLRAGAVFNNKLTIGGFYNTSINQIQPQSETIPSVYMDYRAAGGFVEYTIFTDKLIHLTFPIYIGAGEVEMDNERGNAGLGESNFFLIEPSALLEVNLHKNVKFNIGTGYRAVGSMSYRNFNQSDISGFTGYIGLKLGIF